MAARHDHPYGSARFASFEDIARAGMLRGPGLPFGAVQGRTLYHTSRAGVLIVGGAGSAKTTSILTPVFLAGQNAILVDPKAEIAAVTLDGFAHTGTRVFIFNPYRLFGLPHHRPSLLSHLKTGSSTLVGDSRRSCAALVPDSGGKDRFFDDKARHWLDAILRGIVHVCGSVSFASLFETLSLIRADWDAFLDRAATMAAMGPPDIEAALGEMAAMNTGEARTFDSIMSVITGRLAFMSDPAFRDSLVDEEAADFTLDVLCEPNTVVIIAVPDDMQEHAAPVIRQFFSTARTLKARRPESPPVSFIIDEAASLGGFEEIAELFAIGRGYGLTPLVVYQDLGQIYRNLGPTGAATLSANAALELHLGGGVRDLETAQSLSRRLGNQTIAIDDPLVQSRARQAKREAVHAVLFQGADPLRTGLQLRQYELEAQHVRHQARALLEVNEILNLPQDQTLVLPGGYHIPPFLAEKRPYYTQRALAGRFFPNPYVHGRASSVIVPTRFGNRRRRIIEEPVPSRLAHLPQYRDGRPLRSIEGFRPRP